MSTKLISKALLGVMSAALMAAPAVAGGECGGGACASSVHVMPGYAPEFGPMTVRNVNPMGHLRSVEFQRAPNVSITRIHGMAPTAGLSDAPSGFTGGCHPTSTTYCRQDGGVPVQVELAPAPMMPAPVYQAPVMQAPVYQAPVVMAPAEPRVVRIGGGYDPSKFTPRVYGDPTPVPGIAHVPTSIVDRDPVRAQQVLDSGRTVAQPVLGRDTFGGTVPQMPLQQKSSQPYGGVTLPGTFNPATRRSVTLPGTFSPATRRSVTLPGTFNPSVRRSVTLPGTFNPQSRRSVTLPGTFAAKRQMRAPGLMNTQGLGLAPTRMGQSFGQPGAPVLQRSGPMAGAYGSTVAGDGTYWEKVSGPTAFGDTIATSVICKRQLPTQTVNPVVNVPVPVPVAVPQHCGPTQAQAPVSGGRYGHAAHGRWTK